MAEEVAGADVVDAGAVNERLAAPQPAVASVDAPAQPSSARRLNSRTSHHRWRPRVPP